MKIIAGRICRLLTIVFVLAIANSCLFVDCFAYSGSEFRELDIAHSSSEITKTDYFVGDNGSIMLLTEALDTENSSTEEDTSDKDEGFKVINFVSAGIAFLMVFFSILLIIGDKYKFTAKPSISNFSCKSKEIFVMKNDTFLKKYTSKIEVESNIKGN